MATAFAANSRNTLVTDTLPSKDSMLCLPVPLVQNSLRVKDSLTVFKQKVLILEAKTSDQQRALDNADIALYKSEKLDSANRELINIKTTQLANSDLAGKLLQIKNAELEKEVKRQKRAKRWAIGGAIVATGAAIYISTK